MKIQHEASLIERGTGDEVQFVLLREHSQYRSHTDKDSLQLILPHVSPANSERFVLEFDAQQVFDFLTGAGMAS